MHMPPSRQPRYDNPHHHLDASRFWSEAFAGFNRTQAGILRPRIGPERFITTNFMPFHMDCNPGDFADHMDLFSWDSYPVSGWEKNNANEEFRIADPSAIGLMHDLMGSYTGRWALMEVQPGTINWSGVPVLLYPGAVRLWLWTAWAHGAEFITTYRYRQPLWGIELFHHGLVQTDGVTPSSGGRQFMQVIEEMRGLKKVSASAATRLGPAVGLLVDFEQLWYFATLPQAQRWDQRMWLRHWYAAIARLGLEVKVLHPERDWPEDLPMMIAPSVQMVDAALIERLTRYAQGGGHLVLTCRTGLMNRNGQLFEGPTAQPILPLIGATIDAYDGLPDGDAGHVEMDGQRHAWSIWGDLVRPGRGTRVLARYADQFYVDTPAITQREFVGGGVTYCGVCGEGSLVDALVEKLALQLQLPVTTLPRRVQVLQRDGFHIALNYQTEPIEAPAPANAQFIIGRRTVGPADVAIWRNP
jgi:beta-galactosidase